MSILSLLKPSDATTANILDQSMTQLEQAGAANIAKHFETAVDKRGINAALLMVNSATLLLALREGDLTPLMDMQARLTARIGVKRLGDLIADAFSRDYDLTLLTREGGELYGVTDYSTLLSTVTAYYATQKAKESRFGDLYRGCSDYDDDDDYRFNAPKVAGNEAIIDLTDIKNVATLLPETSTIKGADGKMYTIDTTRIALNIDICGGENTIIISREDPDYAPMVHKSRKKAGNRVWPLSRYGGEIVKLADGSMAMDVEMPCYGDMVNPVEIPIKADGSEAYKTAVKNRGYRPESFTRRMLQEYLTSLLDAEISPDIQQSFTGDGVCIPQYESVYGYGVHKDDPRYNAPMATSNNVIVDANIISKPLKAQTSIPAVESSSGILDPDGVPLKSIPFTKDKAKIANGKFMCLRCRKDGFAKSGLSPYLPSKLPEGMANDHEGLADSQHWAGSPICGACRSELKIGREAVISANKASITGPAPKPVTPKPETKEDNTKGEAIVAAETELKIAEDAALAAMAAEDAAKADVEKKEAAVEGIKAAGLEVDASLAEAVEKARHNAVTAAGNTTTLELAVKAASAKVNALRNGTAIPTTTATANQARVVTKAPTKGKNKNKNKYKSR